MGVKSHRRGPAGSAHRRRRARPASPQLRFGRPGAADRDPGTLPDVRDIHQRVLLDQDEVRALALRHGASIPRRTAEEKAPRTPGPDAPDKPVKGDAPTVAG